MAGILRSRRKGARLPGITRCGVIIVAGLALALAGCGDSESEAEGGEGAGPLAQADEDARAVTQEITSFEQWDPGPGPKPAEGIKLGSVTCLWSVPACKRLADGVKAAGEAIGWQAEVIDGTPDPNNQRQAVQTLLQDRIDAMALVSLDENLVGDLLERANRAEIPWVGINMLRPEEFGAIDNVDVTGELKSGREGGRQLAAWLASKSRGKAKVLMMGATDNPGLKQREIGFREYLEPFTGIEFVGDETIYVPFRDVGPPLQSQVEALMQRYPPGSIDYIYTPFDGFATFVVNGVQAAARDDVKVLGFDGSPQNLEFIRSGRGQVATQATAWNWCSFAAIDELNRQLAGEPIPKKGCPGKVIDESNVPPEGEVFEGDAVDVEAEFRKIWEGGGN